MAGVIGLIGASSQNLSAEIAWVLVFPAFQRSYVTSQFSALSSSPHLNPGVADAKASAFGACNGRRTLRISATAKRMGLKEEALLRWTMVSPESGEGHGPGIHSVLDQGGRVRHSVSFAICADDWRTGREHTVATNTPQILSERM